jgi:hypothetical protein
MDKKYLNWAVGFNYLNIMDALLTLTAIQAWGATELNPAMRYIIDFHPLAFFGFKVFVGAFCTWLLIKKKKYRVFRWATYLYMAVLAWNLIQIYLKYLGVTIWT